VLLYRTIQSAAIILAVVYQHLVATFSLSACSLYWRRIGGFYLISAEHKNKGNK